MSAAQAQTPDGMGNMVPVLETVSKRFGGHAVLNAISLSLVRGGITCLLGPSGCGKSTLLRVAASLLPADGGRVLIDPRDCAMVFQEPRLLPWLTVGENLALPLGKKDKADRKNAVRSALALVELGDIGRLLPRELSGGMAQRVGLARALLRRPRFLLMDEPFAALDAITRSVLQKMLVELISEQKITCLFVTHDINEALLIARHVHVMKNGAIIFEHRTSGERENGGAPGSDPDSSCSQEFIKQQILTHLQKTDEDLLPL